VKLGTQTSLSVLSAENSPRIELISGEAAVTTSRGPSDPLVLVAGNCRSACHLGSDSLLMKFERRLALVSQGNQCDAASPTSVSPSPSRV
jgi:ferric-dicitrate binding protein FerR (iron transport regulator)